MLFYFCKLYYACETVEEGRENLSLTACVRVVGGHLDFEHSEYNVDHRFAI